MSFSVKLVRKKRRKPLPRTPICSRSGKRRLRWTCRLVRMVSPLISWRFWTRAIGITPGNCAKSPRRTSAMKHCGSKTATTSSITRLILLGGRLRAGFPTKLRRITLSKGKTGCSFRFVARISTMRQTSFRFEGKTNRYACMGFDLPRLPSSTFRATLPREAVVARSVPVKPRARTHICKNPLNNSFSVGVNKPVSSKGHAG